MKDKTQKQENNRYTVDLHIRLTGDERQIVQAKADELGCTISQAARSILFKQMNTFDGFSNNEIAHRRLLAMKGTRAEFKKIAASYCAFIDSYNRSVKLTDKDGNPVINTEQTTRIIRTLDSMTLKLQASLNEGLREFGENEVHTVTRTRIPESVAKDNADDIVVVTDNRELEIYYNNMERMMIIGKLTDNASKYKTGNGAERLRFKVSCESVGKNGAKISRTYSIFWRDVDIADKLLKDVSVFVEGTFAQDDNKENLLFADVVKFASE